ncbi:DNA gyrase subunit A [candidate division KSB1 bacterium]|nr:DNA gyrase subunit A [candidate division KSB1 bacterium]
MYSENEKVVPVILEEEMKNSYIDYSMSVIVGRALPDVRDGLKPVHRRILFAMRELGIRANSAYKKSARIVGEVLGKYHPHGDSAVYDAMVRMVQDFSLRYPLIDGQGNFGSVDGDAPAAMRYTEARLAKTAEEVLRDIDKETITFVPNFDESLEEPTVLPSRLPNLLVNGSSGIAVGMATNIPPHNLNEIVDALIALIEKPTLTIQELIHYVTGPDFPTGAIIYGREGIKEAYQTGRGRLLIRARANTEILRNGKENIIVTEIPYQVNKANLIEKIAGLINEKKIEGIADIRDESDRDGTRIVFELKRDARAEIILNSLFRLSQMQVTFGVIMLTLVDNKPKVLNLKEMLNYFLEFRHEIVLKRTQYELKVAERRAHILEGLKIALENIDEVIEIIKKSRNPETARQKLMSRFKLSEIQAQAILDMRLQQLTNLEKQKIIDEYRELLKLIEKLKSILESRTKRMQIVKEELLVLKENFGDARRTEIVGETEEIKLEDMIAEENMVITISHSGFIKRLPSSQYRRQIRGGKGVTAAKTNEEDFAEHLFIASTHHYILFFSNTGRCYWLKVYEIPQSGKGSKGRAIINLLDIEKGEQIAAFVPVRSFDDKHFVIMATAKGIVKKTILSAYGNPRKGGINAINIRPEDRLISAQITNGNHEILLGTQMGKAIRFHESHVRDMGRTATGVTGINLSKGDKVVGMVTITREASILVVTDKGSGKRSLLDDYRITNRGGKGIITMKLTDRTGKMVAIMDVTDEEDLMIVSTGGMIIRQKSSAIKISSRNTQGIRLINLKKGDLIADVAKVPKETEENGENHQQNTVGQENFLDSGELFDEETSES